ncbi:hypothetical protein [Scatolibacter rhodanostii]|uniref:hypothetical protein n=1 Tax=Scatolibacter rhodanostii TaxID=2014781 RepID=UPI000C07685A|nr:hypothetical protein [Scatolibacter rhodanostii]
MARERYLVDSEEDTIHSNQIVLTDKKDIRKNWWHYHKTIIFVILVAIALVISFIYSIVSKEKPDYYVALLTSVSLPTDLKEELENYLEEYAEDVNGDGEVLLRINDYVIGDPVNDPSVDPNTFQAAQVRFTADISSNESFIFLHDEKTFDYLTQAGFEGFFRYKDGTPMPEDKTDYENAMLEWNDVPALADFHPVSLKDEDISEEDVLKLLQRYRISFRSESESIQKKAETVERYEESDKLLQRLLTNEKVQKEANQ